MCVCVCVCVCTYIHIYNKFTYIYVNFIFMCIISSECKSYYRQVKCHLFFDYFHCCILYICCCSVAQSCPTLCSPKDCSTPGFPVLQISWILLKLMSIELVIPSNHLVLLHPLLLLPSIFPNIRVFSDESAHQVAKGLEFQLQHQSLQ